MSKIRLVIVQGPMQLLNVLSVLRYQQKEQEYVNYKDYLVLGGYGYDLKLTNVCLQISKVWNFHGKFLLQEFEIRCHRKKVDFLTAIDWLKKYLNIYACDVVYSCRNWQFINELFLAAYPNANKICYGDGLGQLDLNNSIAFVSQPFNPSGFPPVDEAYLITPVDTGNSFELCQVKLVKPEFFASVVTDSAEKIEGLSNYCQTIVNSYGNSVTVTLTSYDTEAGFVKSFQDEITSYLSSVLPYTKPGETILVKGHPRQKLNQAQVLVTELCRHQRNAIVVPEKFSKIPVELFSKFLKIKKAVTCTSGSCITLAYLCQSELVIGYGEKIAKKLFVEQFREYRLMHEHVLSLIVRQAYTGKFQPLRYVDIKKQLSEFHQEPIWMKGSNPMQYQKIQAQVTEKDIIQSFHKFYYDAAQERGLTWQKTYWMGIPIYKCPLDLWIYQEILFEIKPELIIECGTLYGGSALLLAHLCDLLGKGEIVSIDIEERPNRPQHPRISYWLGSSISETMIERVRQKTADKNTVLVILDSDHRADHVLKELHLYSQFVTPNSYLIVEDTNINGHPVYPEYGPGPMEAVQVFIRENSDFYVDNEREKLYLTFNPSGYLRKRSPQNKQEFLPGFSDTIQQYQQEPTNTLVLTKLRELRKQIALQWLDLPNSQLGSMYLEELGKAHKTLLDSGIKNEILIETEQAFRDEIFLKLSRGFDETKTVQYLLAAMLYSNADELNIPHNLEPIPQWLINDYLNFLLYPKPYFQELGEAENYYQHIEQCIDYLHSSIFKNKNSFWSREVAERFVNNHNFIPLYFNDRNQKDIYVKRAEILEFFLKQKGHELDYDFGDRPQTRRKIRLGILASHFLPSAETFASLPVYEYISRDFEVILYSLRKTNAPLEKYCRSCANSFKQLPEKLKDQVNTIRADDLDLLLIGTNVTAVTNNIFLLSVHRLARVQTTSVASVVTTGIRNIDYYISGQLTDPQETAAEHYREKLVKLEGTAHCFSYGCEVQQAIARVDRELLDIPEEAVVFISGASCYKTIPELIDSWIKIIAAVPNSILLLLPFGPNWITNYPKAAYIKHLKTMFLKQGIATDRLIVLDPQPVPNREDVKEYLKIADIYLDSYPFSGTTSLIEPLQVGLPVVAKQGNCFRGAMGAAILQSLGVSNLVADSEESYIQLAISLGTNSELRTETGKLIRQKMSAKPSFLDSRAYSQKMGSLFEKLLRDYLADGLSENLRLQDTNLIIFPDWSCEEEELYKDFARVLKAIASHPDKAKTTLLIDTSNISEEDADLALSSMVMNLMMEEELDVEEGPDISLVGELNQSQWETLLSLVVGKIALECENGEAIARVKADSIGAIELDSLQDRF